MEQKPTIGRIVHYKLTIDNALEINRRREGFEENTWPKTAQRHVGNHATAGDIVPLIIVRVWPNEYGDQPGVNGQALLDGNDSLWVTSAREGIGQGQWSWPPRA